MNFNEAVDAVLEITARPDKLVEIQMAVNASILRCSTKAEFARDLVESTITIDPTLYGDTVQFDAVSPTPIVTRFRKFKYVKPTGVLGYLTPIGSDKIFSPGNTVQRGVYYVGGNSITYTLKALSPSLEVGYYQYPPILDATVNTTFWMLDLMPYAIIDLACARIFKSIGDDTSAKIYENTGLVSFSESRKDFEDSILAGAT